MSELKETSAKVNALIAEIIGEGQGPERLYDASKHLIQAGGKRLRPFLVIKSCEVVGGGEDVALPVAAAVELLHNFTLIHDDIMDGDVKRRGAPTTHVVWGVPIAIIAGDLLFAKVSEAVIRRLDRDKVSADRALKILDLLTEAAIKICEGQTRDMLFEERETVSEEAYFEMIEGKTAALLKASAEVGAVVGGGDEDQVARLGRFAYYSGLAFQLVDDVLGLTADEEVLGKPVGSDIREGKRTLIIAHFLSHASGDEKAEVLSVLGDRTASAESIARATGLLVSKGSVEYAKSHAEKLAEKAKEQLDALPDSRPKRLLLELSDYIVSRSY